MKTSFKAYIMTNPVTKEFVPNDENVQLGINYVSHPTEALMFAEESEAQSCAKNKGWGIQKVRLILIKD